MKGDFSRVTFDPARQFSRVLMQQGRVLLDADFNEQVAILLHYMQTLAADIIGPAGGPQAASGFGIVDLATLSDADKQRLGIAEPRDLSGDFIISPGRYYIDGVLVENPRYALFTNQAGMTSPPLQKQNATYTTLIYLEAWERHVTAIEEPEIREVALGGPDTTSRARIVWAVRATNEAVGDVRLPPNTTDDNAKQQAIDYWNAWLANRQAINRGLLKAQSRPDPAQSTDLCITPPESRYRGAENQLYRVEVHDDSDAARPTFKWSRDNGSVTFPIAALHGDRVTVNSLGWDERLSVEIGDRVEISDDASDLQGAANPLLEIEAIDPIDKVVTLSGAPASSVGRDETRHPLLRRWDGFAPIEPDKWLTLEDGVQIQFTPGGTYRTGDYWLIPARTATGDVEWPSEVDSEGNRSPLARPPFGIDRHYAPLWFVSVDPNGNVTADPNLDLRCLFDTLCQPNGGGNQ